MIRSLHIKGFQSLADVELELGRFTVIQGRSNSGKSAVVRALRASMTNAANLRGTGGSFIRRGSKQCVVEIRRDEGDLVWTKSSTTTKYDLDGRPFTTGTEVPPEVAESMRLGDIVLDSDNKFNVNFQGGARNEGQFEAPFLVVGRAGSYLAKVFALLTSANVLYSAQAVAKKDVRAKAGRLKTLREVVETDKARLAGMMEQHAALSQVSATATGLWQGIQACEAEKSRLLATSQQLAGCETELAAVEQQLATLGAVDPALLSSVEATMTALDSYRTYHAALATLDAELADVEGRLSAALPADVEQRLAAATSLIEQAGSFRTYHGAVVAADAELAAVDAGLAESSAFVSSATEELLTLVEQLGTCPVCNQAMDRELVLA